MQIADIGGIKIAFRHRRGGPDAVLFIHGLGASMSSFGPPFAMEGFRKYTLAALDLPGCGDSGRPEDFSYTMKDQADLVLKWMDSLGLGAAAIIGHSMGGVIGLYVAESLPPERVRSFINLEGNLSFEDCTFSAKVATFGPEEFAAGGYEKFLHDLEEQAAMSPSPGLREFCKNIKRALPAALHRSAASLVAESLKGDLRARFAALAARRCYVFGERTMIPASKSFLEAQNIPFRVVPGAGHFMMDDRPEEFYRMLLEELK